MKKILLICLLTALLLLVACKKEVEEEPEVVVPEEPVAAPPPEPEPKAPLAEVETLTPETEMISEARCLDNKIELVLTNPTEETLILGKTAKIILNGLIVANPECDATEITPGESIFCADISGPLAIKQGEINKIQINMLRERGISLVNCGG